MLSMEAKIELSKVIKGFEEDLNSDSPYKYGFGGPRDFLMFYNNELNEDEINAIIDIYTSGLKNSQLKESEDKWIDSQSHYFAGNSFVEKWKTKFKQKNFSFIDLVEYTESVRETKDYNFGLRNAEVTLRDDVNYIAPTYEVLVKAYIVTLEAIQRGDYRK